MNKNISQNGLKIKLNGTETKANTTKVGLKDFDYLKSYQQH